MDVVIKTPQNTFIGIIDGESFLDLMSSEDLQNWFSTDETKSDEEIRVVEVKHGYIDELQSRVITAIENDSDDMFSHAALAGIEMNGKLGDVSKVEYTISESGEHFATCILKI